MRPIRGQLLRLHGRVSRFTHRLGDGLLRRAVAGRNVLVGATVEDVGFDERTTAAGVRDMLDAVCELLPEAWRATFLEARAGSARRRQTGCPSSAHRRRSKGWCTRPATIATAYCSRR